jgi:hypothetical protein
VLTLTWNPIKCILMVEGEPLATKKKAIMGRPPLNESEKRSDRVTVVLNAAEFAIINAAAEAAGDPASVWGRKILLKAAQGKFEEKK